MFQDFQLTSNLFTVCKLCYPTKLDPHESVEVEFVNPPCSSLESY